VCTVTFQNGTCYYGRNNNKTDCEFSLITDSVAVACGTPVRRPEDPEPYDNSSRFSSRTYYISKWAINRQDP